MGDVFYFDLDKPISERYLALFPKYIPLIRQYVKVWIESSQFTDEQLSTFDIIKSYHPDRELIEECEYLSKVCNIPFRNVLFLQYMYDFGFNDNNFGCSSIIVNQKDPYIVRNLDWDFNDLIRALTINAIYMRKGEVVFTQLAIVGQLPVAHTLKNNIAAISLHFLQPEYTRKQLLQNLIQNPSQPSIIRFLRKLLEEFNTFDKIEQTINQIVTQHHGILNVISSQKCCSYYIRDWTFNQKLQSLNVDNLLVVTNGDYFEFSTQRRVAAEQKINQLKEITKDNLIQIIREYPNNNETTIYTTILECDIKPFIIIN